jgi:hypothetical protein
MAVSFVKGNGIGKLPGGWNMNTGTDCSGKMFKSKLPSNSLNFLILREV